MDSGGSSWKIPSDQDGYTRQARSCAVGDSIQGVLQHRWKVIYIPEQGGQMQKEITFNYYLIFLLLHHNLFCAFFRSNWAMQIVIDGAEGKKVQIVTLQQQYTHRSLIFCISISIEPHPSKLTTRLRLVSYDVTSGRTHREGIHFQIKILSFRGSRCPNWSFHDLLSL